MYENNNSWFKYKVFILLDLIAIELAFLFATLTGQGKYSIIAYGQMKKRYIYINILLVLAHFIYSILSNTYKDVVTRKKHNEAICVVVHNVIVATSTLVCVLFAKEITNVMKFFYLRYIVFVCTIGYVFRLILKKIYKINKKSLSKKRRIIIITSREKYKEIVDSFLKDPYSSMVVKKIGILGEKNIEEVYKKIPISGQDSILDSIKAKWIDECFLITDIIDKNMKEYINEIEDAGITLHIDLNTLFGDEQNYINEILNGRTVVTGSTMVITGRQQTEKRILDIAGAIIGLFFTGIITIFIGPIIYLKDKGPIFYTQKRIGLNGRTFKLYKFRSMYKDADKRKKELMEQNELSSGLMFKMKNDPRIIKGIGSFIRKTSIDEFPQFYNVLKGEMSLVGTRPPTFDEWEKYELRHRKRMSVKPGITGNWQISGRSNILDFEEVVKLDVSYMQNWNIGKDIKIILKTIIKSAKGEGAR